MKYDIIIHLLTDYLFTNLSHTCLILFIWYMLYPIHVIKIIVSNTCVIQHSSSELLFFASLRFFECNFQQYADVPRKKLTTEYKI